MGGLPVGNRRPSARGDGSGRALAQPEPPTELRLRARTRLLVSGRAAPLRRRRCGRRSCASLSSADGHEHVRCANHGADLAHVGEGSPSELSCHLHQPTPGAGPTPPSLDLTPYAQPAVLPTAVA